METPVDEERWERETRGLRVALVHDWLTGMRGGEQVLEALCRLFPAAPLFTFIHHRGSVSPAIEQRRVHTSIVQRLPLAARHYRHALPLYPFAVELFDLDEFDLVVSSSHCAAKSVVVPGRARHLSYCHSPVRYAWDQFDAYFGPERTGWASPGFRVALAALARWDRRTSGRPDRYVANSQHVARRIDRYYNQRADVVYPPVDTDFFHPDGSPPEAFFLVVSALVPYKRLNVAIEACRRVGVALRIAGDGPDLGRLRAVAGGQVEFLGPVSREDLRGLYRRARAVLMPGEEDFGIVPVEAQACGRPVVALGRGGACETVEDGVTGVLTEPGVEAFAAGLERVSSLTFDAAALRACAQRFAAPRFVAGMRASILALVSGSPDRLS
jgi:glycosyltransferase involved in cell wall biosynthesis